MPHSREAPMHPHDLDTAGMPWSPEAEAGVLGALMLNNSLFDAVGDIRGAPALRST